MLSNAVIELSPSLDQSSVRRCATSATAPLSFIAVPFSHHQSVVDLCPAAAIDRLVHTSDLTSCAILLPRTALARGFCQTMREHASARCITRRFRHHTLMIVALAPGGMAFAMVHNFVSG